MGLRQPSKTAVFFKQSAAGAQQQKEARDKLKQQTPAGQPVQALGGAAAAGTQMVAATTGAQQQATEQVQKTGQEAATNLVTKVAPSQTATVVSGATDKRTGLSGQNTLTVASGESGDVGAVEASGTEINTAIKDITDQINKINDDITRVNAADRKVLDDEKNRLNTLLQTYRDKLSKENLGQIAGPSTFETEMSKREKSLATEGQNVGKLRALFGPRFDSSKYGALASQVYGKDLEAIQEAAAAGLEEKQRAEAAADFAEKEYTKKLEAGKKGYESALEKETKKLDILKLSPQELSAYSRKELEDIFGKDQVTKLFEFDKDDKVTGTTVSATRSALEDRRTKLTAEQAKIESEKNKATEIKSKQLSKEYFPKDEFGANKPSVIDDALKKIKRLPNSTTKRTGSGLGKKEVRISFKGRQQELDTALNNKVAALENDLKNAVNKGNATEAKRIVDLLPKLIEEHNAIVDGIRKRLQDQGYD